jgi:uncharacterized protein HemX
MFNKPTFILVALTALLALALSLFMFVGIKKPQPDARVAVLEEQVKKQEVTLTQLIQFINNAIQQSQTQVK